MKRLSTLFNVVWLPLFLLLSTSWLFGPLLHHDHYGTLAVISHYEAIDQPWGWLFRSCDVAAAILLALATWRFKLIRREKKILAVTLFMIAAFFAIDALFPVGCSGGVCGTFDRVNEVVHVTESVLEAMAFGLATIFAIWRRPSWVNTAFLAAQIAFGALAVSGLLSQPQLMIVHFSYEIMLAAWLAWLLKQFAPPVILPRRVQIILRRSFGLWTLLSGILTIMLALPHQHLFGQLPGITLGPGAPWLVQHGIVTGVLLLYLSRHVSKGQRRAAALLGLILVTQILKYALFTPHPGLLVVSLLAAVILWWGQDAFRRNVGPLPIAARLQDAATIITGVLVAIGVVILIAVGTHHQRNLYNNIGHTYQTNRQSLARRNKVTISERDERRIKLTTETLAVSLLAVLLWSLFRPSRGLLVVNEDDQQTAADILALHSNSSEDFFKIWPEDKQYFFNASRTAFIAYKVSGRVAFALADPICSSGHRGRMVANFMEFCRGHGWSVCFLLVQEHSVPLYESKLKMLQIGSSAVIDLPTFVNTTMREKWWRWQRNRAEKIGFTYEVSMPPHNRIVLRDIATISDVWLQSAGHSEQGFALGYYDETYMQQCTIHLLRDAEGTLVAFANELPTYGDVKQKTVDLIRFLPDIDGAMPVLIMHLLTHLHDTGQATSFDLGFVPLAKLDSTLSILARRLVQSRFSAAGLEQFKGKFRPDWQSNYVAYDGNLVDLAIVLSNLEKALKIDDTTRKSDLFS